MKYVIFKEDIMEGVARAHHLIFPEHMTHSVVAQGYVAAFAKATNNKELFVISAGRCEVDRNAYYSCEVGSTSLGIKGSPGDAQKDEAILNKAEAYQGIIY